VYRIILIVESPKSLKLCGRQPAECRTAPGPQDRDPQHLHGAQRPGLGHNDSAAWLLPAAGFQSPSKRVRRHVRQSRTGVQDTVLPGKPVFERLKAIAYRRHEETIG